MNIRLYVTLLKHQDSQIEYKKLIVMVDTSLKVSMLKRKIEQEFTELFPVEKPFICSKLEDQYGYSLSNSSLVGELLKNDDRLVAVPEEQGKGFISSTDTRELLAMLGTIQENISAKLSDSALSAYNPIKELVFGILPLCYVGNPATMHNACVSLSKALHEGNVLLLDQPENNDLFSLLLNTLNFLIVEQMEQDTVVQRAILDILEVVSQSRKFVNFFKNGTALNKLMSSSRSMNQNSKSRMIRVISNINRGEEQWQKELIDNPSKKYNEKNYIDDSSKIYNQETSNTRGSDRAKNMKTTEFEAKNPEKPRPGGREYKTTLPSTGMGGMLSDFIQMFASQNNTEMICFALHSIENFVSEAVDIAMQDSDLYLKCFNLIDLPIPPNYSSIQLNILKTLASRMTSSRAEDSISKNGITRLLKSFSSLPEKLQPAVLELFEQVLKLGRKVIDIPTLISVCLCPYPDVNTLGMKTLAVLADPAENVVADASFENHFRFFITACNAEKQTDEYKNAAAQCVANLSLREYLRPQIIYCGGVDMLMLMIRNYDRVDGQRMAAKALVNLTATKRDLKMKVVAELSEEIKKLYRNELDGIVSAYLQTLISGR